MLKRRVVLFVTLAVLLAAAACDAISTSVFSQPSLTPTAVRNVLATRQIIFPSPNPPTGTPIPAPPLAPAVLPTQTKTVLSPPTVMPTIPSADGYCCLRFANGPNGQATETFPAGTEIIYAIWDYTALSPGDRIRRIWIRDNLIWLTREEKWDWEKYGADGTVRDLSIFDFEGSGLKSAEYRLQLYLNDDLQQESAFVILPP